MLTDKLSIPLYVNGFLTFDIGAFKMILMESNNNASLTLNCLSVTGVQLPSFVSLMIILR